MTTAINRIRPRAKVLWREGQVVLAVQFAMAGAVKLAGDPALGLAGLMAGAVVTSVAILHADPWLPPALGTVAGLIAWGRR